MPYAGTPPLQPAAHHASTNGVCQGATSEGTPELFPDVLDRIWSHLCVWDVVRMSAVCKSWQKCIAAFCAVKREETALSALAPDGLPEHLLSGPQLLFWVLKRALLFGDAFTGSSLGARALRESYFDGHKNLHLRWWALTHKLANGNCAWHEGGGMCDNVNIVQFAGWREEGFQDCRTDISFDLCGGWIRFGIRTLLAEPQCREVFIDVENRGHLVQTHWVDAAVLALAHAMSACLPGCSPDSRMGPCASKICLEYWRHPGPLQQKTEGWLLTLPGLKKTRCEMGGEFIIAHVF